MLPRFAPPSALLACLTVGVLAAAPTDAQLDFFEKRIRPIFAERCHECHSAEKKQKGGLSLDTREAVLKGGDTGPALVAGDPEKSLLIEAVRYKNHDMQMPPKRQLSEGDVRALEEWVKMGAPDPRTVAVAKKGRVIDIAEGRKFWSFTPLARVEVPEVKCAVPSAQSSVKDSATDGKKLSTHPIDAFIRAKLIEKGLTPAPPADRRTLIRRATFDLLGLPPTPEEVSAFLADSSPDAFDKVVERLLSSPHYGERWARHWLDVARYADSNGMDENLAYGNAWRYRDYVVRAFNADKPFDQFLIEQIAGDLLPRSEDALAATGFLALGGKVLAEPDMQKLEMDIIDEQMDTLGKAFMGMTLGCARCHDHKFDPVAQEDYYAMAAIFRSTRSLSAEKIGVIKLWHEHSLATPQQLEEKKKFDAELKVRKAEVAAFSKKTKDEAKGAALDAGTLAKIAAMTKDVEEFTAKQPDLPSIMGVQDGHIVPTLAVHLRGSYLTLGKPVERGFPEVMRTSLTKPILPAKQSGRLDLARWMSSSEHPLTARVMTNRIWRWHFGAGIVASTDNFGILGAKPSHPELLDWLARKFIESGWSVKDLHRRIMKSATYQQSSSIADCRLRIADSPQAIADRKSEIGNPSANAAIGLNGDPKSDGGAANNPQSAIRNPQSVDPENRLLWRANIQRLEAEEIRDAMLFTSGWLDTTIGGKTIPLKNREFVFNHTSKDATTYESPRRALYLPIIRNHLYDMLEQFDYPDPTMPTGSRNSTVIAPQALIMMNAPVVMQSGEKLAARLAALPDDTQRVQQAYTMLYARPPSDREMADALALLRDFSTTEKPGRAWALLCQTLFAANEFIYLR